MINTTEDKDQQSESQSIKEDKNDIAKRTDTLDKVVYRTREVANRILLIERAMAVTLPEFIGGHPLGAVVDTLAAINAVVSEAENAIKSLKSRVSYAKEVSMPARMDGEQVKTYNTDNFRVTRTARLFASILSKDKTEDAYQWLRDNDLEALIKETVNSSALSAAAKEQIENGKELPDDLFKVHMKDGISITKKKS